MNRMLAAALTYPARLGWPVLPLHDVSRGSCSCGGRPGCKPGKHPRPVHGVAEASTDPCQIRDWWSRWPAANIGVAGSHVWFLDVDGAIGAEWLREQEGSHGQLPRTPRQITQSRGTHVTFLQPTDGRKVGNSVRFAPGCDTRSKGGYVVVAPSKGLQGEYSWDVDYHPLETPVSEAPGWLLDLVTTPARREDEPSPPDEFASMVVNGVDEGARNATLTRLAGYFLRRYVDPYVTLEMLRLWNREGCRPPLPDHDVMIIARSIARREAARRELRDA